MNFNLPAAPHAAALAVIALLLQPGAFAQPAEPPATSLDTVVVKASRSDTLLQEMPLHTTVITQAEIQKSPAQTLDQLLRNVPGLLVPGAPAYTTDPTGQNIKFRGMDKKVLVLVDGMPVLDPFYATIQWFKVPLSSVERVEIVRGGGSSLWGNLAVGGVINIVSKRPTGNDGEASISVGSREHLGRLGEQELRVVRRARASTSRSTASRPTATTTRRPHRGPRSGRDGAARRRAARTSG